MRPTDRVGSTTAARAGLFSVLALAVAVLAGCSAQSITAPASEASPSPTPSPLPTAEGPAIPRTDGRLSAQDMSPTVAPVRITVPAASIDMDVLPQGLDADGQMAVPPDSRVAGWYEFGPGPTSAAGTTVIVAHIDARVGGIGPFSRIKDLPAGSPIAVRASDGSVRDYVATAVQEVAKEGAPMADYFDRSGPPRLVLITCGGIFNAATGHYLDNIVVIATPQ